MSSKVKITYLKTLLEDFTKETNELISLHAHDLNEISTIVHQLTEEKSAFDNNVYFKLAGLINARISFLRKLNIERLKSEDEEEELIASLKKKMFIESSDHSSENKVFCNLSNTNNTFFKEIGNNFDSAIEHSSSIISTCSKISSECLKIENNSGSQTSKTLANSYSAEDNAADDKYFNECKNYKSLSNIENKFQSKDSTKDLENNEDNKIFETLDMAKIESESTTEACMAVMGYIPSDEKTICKFYNQSKGGCFKGSHCTKKHGIINSDGWTNDKKPIKYFNLPPILVPSIGKVVNIKVTHVSYPTVFHGIYHCNTNIQLDPFSDIGSFANYMNDSEVISSYEKLNRDPVVGELVIAPFSQDGFYYRAKVMQPVENGYVQVLFVDYGNAEEVLVINLRQFSNEFANIPAQALTCSLAHVSLKSSNVFHQVDFILDVINKMSTLLLYKVLNCKIINYLGKELEVVAYLEGLDISFHLEQLGFVNRLEDPKSSKNHFKKSCYIPG